LSVDVALLDVNTSVRRLVMPGNARYEFVRDSDGRFRNRSHPRFRGAAIELEPDGVPTLRFTSGTLWRFGGGWVGRGRAQPIAGLNLLIEQRDRHDNTLTITRDPNGGVSVLTQSDGRTIVFTTSLLAPDDPTSARLTEVRDALGRTVHYRYDPTSRRLQSVIDAIGGETRYAYDAEGRIVSIRDQKGVTYVTNDYDAAGRVRAQTMADGGVWRYAYEGPAGAHTLVRVTNPRGHTTTYRLGAGSRAEEVIDALGQSTRAERNPNGLASVITDAGGRATRIDYDGELRPRVVADRGGNGWSLGYASGPGDLETITDPLGNVTRFEYDAARNLRARVNPEGDRLEFGYDARGAPTSVTDALGRTTTATYDAAGNVTSTRDPLGNITEFEHDAGARLVKAIHPTGAVTRWFHDALNRVTHIVDANGGVSTFTYDAKGSLLAFRDARGHTTSYTYDVMDRLRTRTDPLGRTKTFDYDFNGNVVRTTDANGQATEHEYDALNRRVRTRHADGSVIEYVYDALGRLIHVTDTDGGSVLLTYDAQDRLVEETAAHGIVRYAYDRLGRRQSLTVEGSVATTYGYDRNSRLTTLSESRWGTATLEYFPTGRLQRRALPSGLAARYDYDETGRITHMLFEHPARGVLGELAYGYDAAGRRTSSSGNLAHTLLPEPTSIASYDAANQQLLFGDYTLTYDRTGKATSLLGPDGLAVLVWDARDRLRNVTAADGTLSFAYDAFGRRTGRADNDAVASYQYAGGDVVREARGTLELAYLRGLGADETLGQDGLAYMIDGTRSTIAVVDDAGNIAQTFAYEPFGRAQSSGAADGVRYQFTGRERDTDWLYYYRVRYYSPPLGRFLQPDPLGLRGEPNPYAYALNNPVDNLDPSGLRTYIAHGCCNPNMDAVHEFRTALRDFDTDVRLFIWSSDLLFDVIPTAQTPSKAMLEQIIRDLQDEPLEPGEKLNLIGHSAGGIIVNNVANALRALGIQVDNMITMGSPLFPGTINAALPSDIAITNFTAGRSGDFLANTLSGPNVINVPVTNVTDAGTSDFLTAHT
jgi:RHS repeat-associated protein